MLDRGSQPGPFNAGHRVVRVGMVGGGYMGKAHTMAWRAAPIVCRFSTGRPELVRLACSTSASAAAAAHRLGWSAASNDWRTVTQAHDIDLVDIVTPPDTHAEIAIDALRHGKHVLCEKPLESTAADARRMCRADAEGPSIARVAFIFRTWPAARLARQFIEEGVIGAVHRFSASFLHDFASDVHHDLGWRGSVSIAGGGSMVDMGSHLVDLARFLVGDVTSVRAQSHAFAATGGTAEPGLEDTADLWLDFACGATGVLHTNWKATGCKAEMHFHVIGDDGAVRFSWEQRDALQLYVSADPHDRRGFRTIYLGPQHRSAERFWPVPGQGLGYGDAFVSLIADLLDELAGTPRGLPSFDDALQVVELLAGARASARSNSSKVALPQG
jgi:predicted dehydrogenase